MGTRVTTDLNFDGSSSTADQFSGQFFSFGGREIAAFMFDANVVTGPLGVTLQINPDDPTLGETVIGWQDLATDTVFDSLTSATLTQTDANIEGGETRSGILDGPSKNFVCYLEFTPVDGAAFRLRFQLHTTTVATVSNIYTLP